VGKVGTGEEGGRVEGVEGILVKEEEREKVLRKREGYGGRAWG